jgi:hypothetical protein
MKFVSVTAVAVVISVLLAGVSYVYASDITLAIRVDSPDIGN